MGLEEQEKCIDPEYQRDLNKQLDLPSSTFYPKGTICFKDPSASKYLVNCTPTGCPKKNALLCSKAPKGLKK